MARHVTSFLLCLLQLVVSPLASNGYATIVTPRCCSSSPSSIASMRTTRRPPFTVAPLRMSDSKDSSEGGDGTEGTASFYEAASALEKEEEDKRMAETGLGLSEEQEAEFEAKKGTFDDMRARIRARTTDLGIEESVATKEAVEAATRRAMAGADATSDQLDLSKIGDSVLYDPSEELTEEQQAEIDKVSQLSFFEQAKEEFANTKWPSFGATLRQSLVMVLIFVVSATIILNADEFIRTKYTELGFIPRPDEVYDFSDLELPEKWEEMMTDADIMP
eukprot:CAMPEP_0185724712 /NCGR_PEP_ID=MMETSP1171-20130828/1114_1 /TAXON_ID=374046 /ORGANISM="Helicotheca tamensis, Strain CCMP826" /LENGTH=276 /DNA_ID=CAMNT_0028392631 /DNA_START=142 /DNA_END=975 /DNA_ORIENTATION=+